MTQNVVLITVDSLRADYCGFMNHQRATTPTIDRIARDGVVFKNAIAPGPSTYESLPAMFTGNMMVSYSNLYGDADDDSNRRRSNIRQNMNHETIAEWFANRGYSTCAFTPNPFTGSHTPFSRGFGKYEDFLSSAKNRSPSEQMNVPVVSEFENAIAMIRRDRASKPWKEFYDDIVQWISSAEEPYFLWIFLLEPHTPYLIDGSQLSDFSPWEMYYHNWKLWLSKKWNVPTGILRLDPDALSELYLQTIQSVDTFLTKFLSDVDDGETSIVLHSDHGEAFNEHGIFGHRNQLHEENIHVPLIIYNLSESAEIERPVSLVELPRILAETSQGELYVPNSEYAVSRTLYSNRIAIRTESWKYIGTCHPRWGEVHDEEMYALSRDPGETENLIRTKTRRAGIFRDVVSNYISHENELLSIKGATDGWTHEI